MAQVQQLSGMIAQQKSFRDQLEYLHQSVKDNQVPTPGPQQGKKLTNQLANFFKNM